jgi:putative ABC transport system permease protein
MVLRDLKYTLRQFRKSPGFALTVVLMLALGIGANTAVFSVVDAVMLRPLPYVQPQRLVQVESFENSTGMGSNVSYPDFFDWRSRNRSFSHLVSYHDNSFTLTGVQRAVHLDGEIVSWDLLPMLGIHPELGRGFVPDEEKKGTRVILISHSLWESQFAGDKSVVGRAINLSGQQYTVIGVMPASFCFPVEEPHNSFWTTLAIDDDSLTNRGSHFFSVMGRLKDGVTFEQANQDMKSIAAQLAQAYPDTNTRHPSAEVISELESLLGDTRTFLFVVLSGVALVLLIACGNIANLQLARVRDRQREIAVRAALGAGRAGIIRQLLVENLVLGLAGGAAGCGLAYFATPAILRLIGDSVPRAADAGVDLRVLGFALFASLLSALIFGLVPAVTASKTDLASTLQQSSRSSVSGGDWLRKSVTVAQVAFGIVLTAAAGLLISSFIKLRHTDEGFNPANVLTLTFETPDSAYKDTRPEFYRRYFERLRALPGVQSAAGAVMLPMTDDLAHISFENPEQPVAKGRRPASELAPISDGFFHAMQVPFIKGRDFNDADNLQSTQVMIVNQAFAQKYFPGEEPIGKKLKPGAGNGDPGGPPWRQIVGIVGNVRHSATQREMEPVMYLPANQLPGWCCLRSVVRTSVDPLSLEPSVRQLVASMDSNIPVTEVRTMPELLSLQLAEPRFAMVLLGSFAALALILTVIGLYGVMAYSVARRTREIGLRLALGAQRAVVLRMVLRDAALLVGSGIAIGLVGAFLTGPVLAKMLFGAGPRDPFILSVVCAGVALAGMVAAYVPALRAASIEPMQALRTE